jgi:spermidine synthase
MTAFLLAVLFVGTAQPETVIHSERSLYRDIIVFENSGERCMRFTRQNNSQQSCIYLNDPNTLVFNCNKLMMGALYLKPDPGKVLVIGMGGGTLPSTLMKILPKTDFNIVEIDPAVVRVAKKYFGFLTTSRVNITEEDGRVFVKRAIKKGEKYDLIMLDAFDGKYVPPHMLTRQFLAEVKMIMAPDGVLAANTFATSPIYDNESVTYESVFGGFYNLKKIFSNSRIILVKKDGLLTAEKLENNARIFEDRFKLIGIESSWLLPLFSTDQDWSTDARILTDQFSSLM